MMRSSTRKRILEALKERDALRWKENWPRSLMALPLCDKETGELVSLTENIRVGRFRYEVEFFTDGKQPDIRRQS